MKQLTKSLNTERNSGRKDIERSHLQKLCFLTYLMLQRERLNVEFVPYALGWIYKENGSFT